MWRSLYLLQDENCVGTAVRPFRKAFKKADILLITGACVAIGDADDAVSGKQGMNTAHAGPHKASRSAQTKPVVGQGQHAVCLTGHWPAEGQQQLLASPWRGFRMASAGHLQQARPGPMRFAAGVNLHPSLGFGDHS